MLLTMAVISGLLWTRTRSSRLRLDILALITAGGAVMFTVDTLFAYFETGESIVFSRESMLISIIIAVVAILAWIIVLIGMNRLIRRK